MLGGLSINLSAEGEYPNVLIIQQNDGIEKAFLLEECTLSILPSAGKVTVMSAGEENNFPLSDVKGVKYVFRDPSTLGMNDINYSDVSLLKVYRLDGSKFKFGSQSMQRSLYELPHGVYVIKVNGRTVKIAK